MTKMTMQINRLSCKDIKEDGDDVANNGDDDEDVSVCIGEVNHDDV